MSHPHRNLATFALASIIVFIEEILPSLDFIPTFTLMWLYTFVWKKEEQIQPITIEFED